MVDDAMEAGGLGSRWLPEPIQRVVAGSAGPTVVALALALVSLPLTVMAILGSPQPNSLDGPTALNAGLGAVIAGALAGGYVGGRIRRRHELTGAVIALVIGWAAAIVAFPIIPGLLGQTFQLGQFCLDSCNPLLDTSLDSPLAIVFKIAGQYGTSVVIGTVFGGIVAVPALLLAIFFGRRSGITGRRVCALVAAGAVGIVNMFSIQTFPAAFAILFAGVVLWSMILPRPAPSPSPA
jgi:hypothetical protein